MFWKRALKFRYAKKIREIEHRSGKKIQVIFLVNETSKWKYQQVYDLLRSNEKYEVGIVVTLADVDSHLSHDGRIEKLSRNKEFFNS